MRSVETRRFTAVSRLYPPSPISPPSPFCSPYSWRSACIGSILDALTAGRYPAPNATAVNAAIDPTITTGSQPFSSYSNDFAAVPSASAPRQANPLRRSASSSRLA